MASCLAPAWDWDYRTLWESCTRWRYVFRWHTLHANCSARGCAAWTTATRLQNYGTRSSAATRSVEYVCFGLHILRASRIVRSKIQTKDPRQQSDYGTCSIEAILLLATTIVGGAKLRRWRHSRKSAFHKQRTHTHTRARARASSIYI